MVTATFLTEDSYLGSLTEPLTLNRYNYCVSSYLNYTDPSGNEVEVLESLKGWISNPDAQAQKTIDNYENQRLSIESGLLNNRAGQIFLDYGDIVMGPSASLPASLVGLRETAKGNFDSKEMQRTATAGFYAGFVGQGIEYTQIISNADYQLSMIITSAKGVNSINNPLSYLLFIKDFSLTQTLDAAKAGLQDAWNGTYDSAIGRKIGAGTFNYLLMTIGGAQLKGKGNACEAVESGTDTTRVGRWMSQDEYDKMVASGKVQMSGDNKVHVANPADINAFGKQAPKGSVYVEFDVPSNTISKGGTDGWGIINGPGSLLDRLNAKKGLPRITEMPNVTNISIEGSK